MASVAKTADMHLKAMDTAASLVVTSRGTKRVCMGHGTKLTILKKNACIVTTSVSGVVKQIKSIKPVLHF